MTPQSASKTRPTPQPRAGDTAIRGALFIKAGIAKALAISLSISSALTAQALRESYYPGRSAEWERREPSQVGADPVKLAAAVAYAEANFNKAGGYNASREPFPETIGPVKKPSGMNGLIVRHGYIIAEWGDTHAVDMTFSVSKTYLSTVAGLAVDAKKIDKLSDPVRRYVQDGSFDAPHNREISWHQLLNQTSGWEGTLFEKPDWSDRFNGKRRAREYPGKHWRYNDVRVNVLALALLQVWRKPLPRVLHDRIMGPIGASRTWRWHGYRNSYVVIDGLKVQSVSGGGHWGGGMFINTRDQARFGYLMLRNGKWRGRQLISEDWILRAKVPTPQMKTYGYMNWFLNTKDRKRYKAAPIGNVFFMGPGTNMIWLDPDHDLVVVVRWIKNRCVNTFIQRVLGAMPATAKKGEERRAP